LSEKTHAAGDQVGEAFLSHARLPRHQTRLDAPDGVAVGVGQCGDSVEVTIQMDGDVISCIGATPNGCLYTVVCASALGDLAKGRKLESALEINPQDVDQALGGLPEDHQHCARLVVNTLGEAIEDYYRRAGLKAKPAVVAKTGS
jgi:nitrogen fixation NifU-like protein